jgi:hypothetical protein
MPIGIDYRIDLSSINQSISSIPQPQLSPLDLLPIVRMIWASKTLYPVHCSTNPNIRLESAPIGQHDSVANGQENVFDPLVFLNSIVQRCDRPRLLILRTNNPPTPKHVV